MTPFDLSGRVAIVTGASGGLGERFAKVLAGAGAHVVLAARREDRLLAVCADIRSAGGEADSVALDVTDATSVRNAFDAIYRQHGRLDIVVNNSGVATAMAALDVEEADWDHVLDTNLKGAWLVAREAGRRMRDAGNGGSIINIASVLSFRVTGGVSAYAASKAGLMQLTRAYALELARYDIRVNAIAPGYILTDMNRGFFSTSQGEAMMKRIPQRRVGDPKELDGPLLLLASDASSYMTGSVIVVDGGHLQSSL